MNRAFEVDPVLLRSLRDQFGLSEVEHFILAAAHIDPGDPRRLYYAAAELASRIPGAGPISVLEATEAIKSCLARKLLQVVTEETILHAKSRVAKASAIGPLNGWPFPGEITFTESGWELFVLLYRRIAECAPAVSEFVPYAPSTRWRQFDLCLQIFLDRTAAMAYQDSLGFCYEQLLCPVMSVGDLRPFAWDEATEAFAMLVKNCGTLETVDCGNDSLAVVSPSYGGQRYAVRNLLMQGQGALSMLDWAVLVVTGDIEVGAPRSCRLVTQVQECLVANGHAYQIDEVAAAVRQCESRNWIVDLTDHPRSNAELGYQNPKGVAFWRPGGDVYVLSGAGSAKFKRERDLRCGGNWKRHVLWEETVLTSDVAFAATAEELLLWERNNQVLRRDKWISTPKRCGPWCQDWYAISPSGFRVQIIDEVIGFDWRNVGRTIFEQFMKTRIR